MAPLLRIGLRALLALPVLAVLGACDEDRVIDLPPPETPRLEAVHLLGQRVCGQFEAAGSQFTFDCDPLPTSAHTGWQLTPLRKPHPANANWSIPNRGIVFTVSTPSLTSIEISELGARTRRVLRQVAPGPGQPQMLEGMQGNAEVAATDDGTRKTWTIAVQTSACRAKTELAIVNISNGTRSDTLPIHVVRADDETVCFYGPGTGTIDGPVIGTSPGTPPTPPPTGACPGNTSRTMFEFCERCTNSGTSWVFYKGIESCSVADARAQANPAPGCTLSQVSSRAQCEGSP